MENVKEDGRFKRSERSRRAIIDAMLELIEQGQYIPTAQQVADQAEISIRTVFRHFTEMEELYKELNEAIRPSYEKYFINQDLTGTLEQRIERLVSRRLIGYVESYHIIRSSQALFWRSQILTETYHRNQRLLRKLLLEMLPELEDKGEEIINIADALTSFEVFERYFNYQKLNVDDCSVLLSMQLKQLLSDNS